MADSEMSDVESSRFVKKPMLYGYEDSNTEYKRKYYRLKLLCVGLMCLLFGLFAGGVLQQFLDVIRMEDLGTTSINGDPSPGDIFDNFGLTGNGKRRERRKNEDECSARRCCRVRDGIKQSELPKKLKCNRLSDEECGAADEFCEWDCDPTPNRRGIRRKYRGISLKKGTFQLPNAVKDSERSESFEECMREGKVLSVDDCGVQYEEELDPEELKAFCKHHALSNGSKKGGKPSGDGNSEVSESDLRRRLDVIGNDDRIEVTNNLFPFRAVFYVEFDKPSGGTFRCTATMISDRWAITAAHCVYGNGDWYSNWKLYKNVYDCDDRTDANKYTVNYWASFVGYTQMGLTWDYDIAWLRLTVNPGLGYLDFGYDSSFSGTQWFNIVSHPADKPDCSKWRQYCPYDGPWTTHQQVTHACDTSGGASGSAIYKYWSSTNTRIIFAIHAKGACYEADGSYHSINVCNTGIRITAGKYNTICNYVAWNNPNHCNNEHPTFS